MSDIRRMHERERGTKVWSSATDAKVKIEACRVIMEEKQYAKIDGFMVDTFSAAHVVLVYDALNDTNRASYLRFPIHKMVSMAYKLTSKGSA